MYDPLATSHNSPFASSSSAVPTPTWPAVPHSPELEPSFGKRPSAPPTPIKAAYDPNPREPQIYGQQEPGLISPSANTLSNGNNLERSQPYVRIRLTALDRNRKDILIRFDAQTNLPNFQGATYRNVSRSYAEFQRFAEQIVYSNPQTIIPALPLAQTSAPTDEEDDRLVKIMLQRWLTRICEDSVVIHDEELRSFVESDFGYQPTIRQKRKTSSGFSLLRRGVPDEDEELMAARYELTRLETQFFDAAKAIDKVSHARKAIAASQAELGNKLVSAANTEGHPQLANALRKLGRAYHSIADSQQAYSIGESVILGDSLGYQGMNSKSAKDTLLQRSLALEEAQTAAKSTINKRRQIERLKASSNIRPEKVDEALEELEEAQQIENILARRVDGISQNLHRAMITHSKYTHDDITACLIEHARSSLIHERTVKRELEAIRADVRQIGEAYRAPVSPQAQSATPVHERAANVPLPYSPVPSTPASAMASPVATNGHRDPLGDVRSPIPLAGPPLVGPVPAAAAAAPRPGIPGPLNGSMIIPPRSASAAPGVPPRSMTSTPVIPYGARAVGPDSAQTLGRSFNQSPRYKIDQREAARKLANFL
ncbi:hypothetical protein DL93DRAFT_2179307 [Clavulina sp. PMI_390]|nr:hypothetical protein DL93DRAFT_2179307 [Clavulina sp. PMI_390]